MDVGAHAAGALGKMLGVAGIAALEDDFQSAEELRGAPGVFDFSVFNFDHDPQVAFDAGDGIDHKGAGEGRLRRGFALSHMLPPSRNVRCWV